MMTLTEEQLNWSTALRDRPMRDVLTGSSYRAATALSVAGLLGRFPVALLEAEAN